MRYVPRRVLPALLDVPSGAAPESPCRGLHEALARKNSSRDTRHSAAAWLQSPRNQMRLAHLPLNQQTSGVNVTASLGGGQGDGTTDPSACSDLKGREVGIRSAEPHEHPRSHLRGEA